MDNVVEQKLKELHKKGKDIKDELIVIKECVAQAIDLQKQGIERENVLQASLTQLALEIDAIDIDGDLRQFKKTICSELFG
jgi:acid stress-induced BolA-like protein IbaG/YrbA